MSKNRVVKPRRPETFSDDPLTAVLRSGPPRLLAQAVEMEVSGFLAAHADLKDDLGRQRIVRHGHHRARRDRQVDRLLQQHPPAPGARLPGADGGLARWRRWCESGNGCGHDASLGQSLSAVHMPTAETATEVCSPMILETRSGRNFN